MGSAVPGVEGKSETGGLLRNICLFAHRVQALVEKAQFGNEVSPATGFEMHGVTHSDLFGEVVYRSYELDFFNREAEVAQYTTRRLWIDVNICLTHGLPQLVN